MRVFGSSPSAIAAAFWELLRSGQLGSALYESLQPFFISSTVAIVVGIPIGLVLGRFLLEGLPAVLFSFVILSMLPDTIAEARWLTPGEKAWLQCRLDTDSRPACWGIGWSDASAVVG